MSQNASSSSSSQSRSRSISRGSRTLRVLFERPLVDGDGRRLQRDERDEVEVSHKRKNVHFNGSDGRAFGLVSSPLPFSSPSSGSFSVEAQRRKLSISRSPPASASGTLRESKLLERNEEELKAKERIEKEQRDKEELGFTHSEEDKKTVRKKKSGERLSPTTTAEEYLPLNTDLSFLVTKCLATQPTEILAKKIKRAVRAVGELEGEMGRSSPSASSSSESLDDDLHVHTARREHERSSSTTTKGMDKNNNNKNDTVHHNSRRGTRNSSELKIVELEQKVASLQLKLMMATVAATTAVDAAEEEKEVEMEALQRRKRTDKSNKSNYHHPSKKPHDPSSSSSSPDNGQMRGKVPHRHRHHNRNHHNNKYDNNSEDYHNYKHRCEGQPEEDVIRNDSNNNEKSDSRYYACIRCNNNQIHELVHVQERARSDRRSCSNNGCGDRSRSKKATVVATRRRRSSPTPSGSPRSSSSSDGNRRDKGSGKKKSLYGRGNNDNDNNYSLDSSSYSSGDGGGGEGRGKRRSKGGSRSQEGGLRWRTEDDNNTHRCHNNRYDDNNRRRRRGRLANTSDSGSNSRERVRRGAGTAGSHNKGKGRPPQPTVTDVVTDIFEFEREEKLSGVGRGVKQFVPFASKTADHRRLYQGEEGNAVVRREAQQQKLLFNNSSGRKRKQQARLQLLEALLREAATAYDEEEEENEGEYMHEEDSGDGDDNKSGGHRTLTSYHHNNNGNRGRHANELLSAGTEECNNALHVHGYAANVGTKKAVMSQDDAYAARHVYAPLSPPTTMLHDYERQRSDPWTASQTETATRQHESIDRHHNDDFTPPANNHSRNETSRLQHNIDRNSPLHPLHPPPTATVSLVARASQPRSPLPSSRRVQRRDPGRTNAVGDTFYSYDPRNGDDKDNNRDHHADSWEPRGFGGVATTQVTAGDEEEEEQEGMEGDAKEKCKEVWITRQVLASRRLQHSVAGDYSSRALVEDDNHMSDHTLQRSESSKILGNPPPSVPSSMRQSSQKRADSFDYYCPPPLSRLSHAGDKNTTAAIKRRNTRYHAFVGDGPDIVRDTVVSSSPSSNVRCKTKGMRVLFESSGSRIDRSGVNVESLSGGGGDEQRWSDISGSVVNDHPHPHQTEETSLYVDPTLTHPLHSFSNQTTEEGNKVHGVRDHRVPITHFLPSAGVSPLTPANNAHIFVAGDGVSRRELLLHGETERSRCGSSVFSPSPAAPPSSTDRYQHYSPLHNNGYDRNNNDRTNAAPLHDGSCRREAMRVVGHGRGQEGWQRAPSTDYLMRGEGEEARRTALMSPHNHNRRRTDDAAMATLSTPSWPNARTRELIEMAERRLLDGSSFLSP